MKTNLHKIIFVLVFLMCISHVEKLSAQVPVAEFSASILQIEQYQTVQFFDSSTNSPYQWEWEIYDSTTYASSGYYPDLNNSFDVYSDPNGNGKDEFSQNPEFAFDVPGIYTVTLRSRNNSGWSSKLVKKGYIRVILPTKYALGYGTYGPNNDNKVESDYGTISDDGGNILNYGNNQGLDTRSFLLIRPCNANKIILTMSQLKFADNNDKLSVYDAEFADNTKVLAVWTKNSLIPKTVTALSGSMYIKFDSDGSGVDSGYFGTYSVELDTGTYSPSLTLSQDSVFYTNVPIQISSVKSNIFGVPVNYWTVNGNPTLNNSKDTFNFIVYSTGAYICNHVKHCRGEISACKTIYIVNPQSQTLLNFTASETLSTPFKKIRLTPHTDKADRFLWKISPTSYEFLNAPISPSFFSPGIIYYNESFSAFLPAPEIRFLDTVCYTITLTAYHSSDSNLTAATLVKTNYICGQDPRKTNGIYGRVYHDANNNCNYDNSESGISSIQVNLYDSLNKFMGFTYTLKDGIYGFEKKSGNYRIKTIIKSPGVSPTCPSDLDTIVSFDTASPIGDINFGLKCSKAKIDAGVNSILTSGWVFPGQTHNLKINAGIINDAFILACRANASSGKVKIKVSGKVTYKGKANGALTPQVSGNTYTYNISDFYKVNKYNDFGLMFRTDTNAISDDSIFVEVEVLTDSTDADTTNNKRKFFYRVVNSYDPNMKEVYPGNVEPGYKDWFYYTIHFQNTGSAPAFNIRLEDTLDTKLDPESLQVTDYSHNARLSLNGRTLKFYFADIMLPDSFTNKKGSMGYVQYRIKPFAGITEGNSIKNTAYIYFDYNKPVITNTTVNNFAFAPTGIKSSVYFPISVYPNPSSGIFRIDVASGSTINAEVFTAMGASINTSLHTDTEGTYIDMSTHTPGIYFVKLNVNGNEATFMIMKQ